MEKIIIDNLNPASEIRVGENWKIVSELIPDNGVFIVTDENVNRIYGDFFPEFPLMVIPEGEKSKKLGMIEHLAGEMLNKGIDRSGFILAIGGGVVCDIAGFLGAVYMRGIRCGYVSTTLLAQVDASTGGKNGVNLSIYKNIIGTIRQPEFVICDTSMLLTLPEEEYLSGLAELIKTAVIGDRELFDLLEQHHDEVIRRNTDLLEILVARAVRFKASVVSEDEREKGLRRILNFGHTFGHAVELEKSVRHGFAVAAGMEMAVHFSVLKGYCSEADAGRILSVLEKYGLNKKYHLSASRINTLVMHDKKKSGDNINFIFTRGIGNAFYEKVSEAELMDFYRNHINNQLE